MTPWGRKCPRGHVDLVRRHPERVNAYGGRMPQGEFYCNTCKQSYASEQIKTETQRDRGNVSPGYIWSPSHDD